MSLPIFVEGVPIPSVQDNLDREVGKPCWIIGGGPSLLRQDRREIDGIVMAVNFSITAEEKLGFPAADYWIFGDTAMFWRPRHRVINPDDYPGPRKFVAGPPIYYLLGRGYEPDREGRGKHFVPYYNNSDFIISRRASYLWAQGSTLCCALSLAWLLGCNPINIRGADFGVECGDGRIHWYDPPGPPTVKPDAEEVNYERMRRPAKTLIAAMIAQNPELNITAGGDPSILEA